MFLLRDRGPPTMLGGSGCQLTKDLVAEQVIPRIQLANGRFDWTYSSSESVGRREDSSDFFPRRFARLAVDTHSAAFPTDDFNSQLILSTQIETVVEG